MNKKYFQWPKLFPLKFLKTFCNALLIQKKKRFGKNNFFKVFIFQIKIYKCEICFDIVVHLSGEITKLE